MEFLKMNLQLFAVAASDINRTSDNTSGNDFSPTMKEYYDTELLENARANLYFNQFGKKQPLPANNGDTVEWRKFNTFSKAMTPLTEGVTPEPSKFGMTKIKQSISQHGDYTYISDRLDAEAVDPIIVGATEEFGASAGETLDAVTRNEVVTGTYVLYPNSKTSRYALETTDRITGTLVNKAFTHLKKMKAPKIEGCYVCIIHPSVSFDLREDDDWIDAHKYASPEEIFNGEIGKLHNVRFVESTEAKIFCGEDLSDSSRTLTVASAASATDTISVSETLTEDELIGRLVLIDGVQYEISDNGTSTITLIDPLTEEAASVTASASTVIYPGEGGSAGTAVYALEFFGKDAWGVVEPSAEGMEMIIKPKGSAGTADPLNQRSSVGWKASTAAKILYEERLLRLEVCSEYSDVDEAN